MVLGVFLRCLMVAVVQLQHFDPVFFGCGVVLYPSILSLPLLPPVSFLFFDHFGALLDLQIHLRPPLSKVLGIPSISPRIATQANS